MSTAASLEASATHSIANFESLRLHKQLGFVDLIFACVLMVVVPDFFGTAVRSGNASTFLWLLGIVFFFIPQSIVVSRLNKQLPLEGGLYEWARIAFGDLIGFLAAWNLWVYVILYSASVGLVASNYLSYVLGPNYTGIGNSRTALTVLSSAIIGALMLVTHLGLGFGKWLTNAGSFLTVLILVVLISLPFVWHGRGHARDFHPFALHLPPLNLASFSIFSKMMFGALCGLEYAAIFAGESRNPAKHFPRAILWAVPLVAVAYIAGTSAILAFVPADSVDLIGPIPQALQVGFAGMGLARVIAPIAILLLLTNYLSSFALNFAANTRLPMVAGWDHLLPAWFTRLHPKYRTPVNSILFLGLVTLATSVAALVGVRELEAFTTLQIWGFTFYGLAYLALFAIPLWASKESRLRANPWTKLCAALGLSLTLMFVALSIVPVVDVANRGVYAAKTIAVLAGANLFALVLFYKSKRKQ